MSKHESERLGWIERAYGALPLSPWAVGGAIAGVLVLAFGVSELAFGRHLLLLEVEDTIATMMRFQARTAVANMLLAAFLPTAYIYLLRGHRGTLGALRSDLGCSDTEFAALIARIGNYNPLALGLSGLAGVGCVLLMTRVTTPAHIDPWQWSALPHEMRWTRVLVPWVGWWIGVLILAVSVESNRLAPLASRLSRVDLPDLRPFRPFTRQALLNTLLMILFGAFGLLTIAESGSWALVLGFWIVSMGAMAIGLVVWLLPVFRVVRDAKRSELDWCRDALVREGAKLREGGALRSRVSELVAWEERVQSIGEWPIDSPALRKILLYSLIPLGSWAGGALVERFIDSLLG
ncbi:MAG: hypothetical protein GY937_25325 [bacterium]|nr:hypothetical protein [bacterium]